jgi:hypothetical protein
VSVEEDFTVAADQDGALSLQCCYYAKGCWWEERFGVHTFTGDDLGSLLGAAREHLRAAHPEGAGVDLTERDDD